MIKLLMSVGFDRNAAVREADACDGRTSHIRIMNRLCVELLRIYYKQLKNTVIEGDMTGAVPECWEVICMDEYCIVKQRAGPLVKVFSTDRA